jgi:hypothetical protein
MHAALYLRTTGAVSLSQKSRELEASSERLYVPQLYNFLNSIICSTKILKEKCLKDTNEYFAIHIA